MRKRSRSGFGGKAFECSQDHSVGCADLSFRHIDSGLD